MSSIQAFISLKTITYSRVLIIIIDQSNRVEFSHKFSSKPKNGYILQGADHNN